GADEGGIRLVVGEIGADVRPVALGERVVLVTGDAAFGEEEGCADFGRAPRLHGLRLTGRGHALRRGGLESEGRQKEEGAGDGKGEPQAAAPGEGERGGDAQECDTANLEGL